MLTSHRVSQPKPAKAEKSAGSNRRQHYFAASSAASSSKSAGTPLLPATALPPHVPASMRCPPVLNPFGREDHFAFQPPDSEFSWLDRQANNNSGESSSRKVASKETSRKEVENWYYMSFRFRRQGYQSLIYAVHQSAREDSIFSEDHLDKWTCKMRFRIRRSSPLKTAIVACAARLGLEADPDVLFCIDGFYGDTLSGRVHNRNEVPNRVVIATSTCRSLGLGNGSCLFVSRASRNERDNATIQTQLDLLRAAMDDGDDFDLAEEDSIIWKFGGRNSPPEKGTSLTLDSSDSDSQDDLAQKLGKGSPKDWRIVNDRALFA